MMHGSNGNSDNNTRYLPMDYGMHAHHHAPHHAPHALQPPTHHPHPHHDPHLYALPPSVVGGVAGAHAHGMKRSPESAGLDLMSGGGASSDEDEEGSINDVKPNLGGERGGAPSSAGRGTALAKGEGGPPAGKKTKGRVKIKMEFIDNKLRRYTTFSKRKTGIMKKAYELSTLTGTQVMLLVASETGHVYTFATRKLQPMITSDAGKALIQTCLNSPDPPQTSAPTSDQRMSASGYEETELTYNAIADAAAAAAAADAAEQQKENEEEEDEEEEEIEMDQQNVQPHSENEDEEEEEITHFQASTSRALFPSTSSAIQATSTSTSVSSGNLPPDVVSRLLATGHLIKEDGTLVRLSTLPAPSSPSVATSAGAPKKMSAAKKKK